MRVPMAVRSDERKDIATITRGAVDPQARPFAIQLNLQTATWAAQHIANDEFAMCHLASREQGKQHALEPCHQGRSQFIPLGIADRRWGSGFLVIEIKHGHLLRRCLMDSSSQPWSRSLA